MEMQKNYNPGPIEAKWYQEWTDNKLFHSEPDNREPYTLVIPPPNVTGVLHMGHLLNNTIQDALVRLARMQGKNACWVPGTDHASIATESKVVSYLDAKGINKSSLSRDEFMRYAWEWKEKHGGIIIEQLKKLGASCDWDRTKFTMDTEMSESVIQVFIDLYNKGHIYRGVRMVNWDPQAQTAVSDEEVIYKEVQSKLYYVRYYFKDNEDYMVVATTRPETILGDTAVCVNPEDPKYKHFVGKKVIVPMVNRLVPVIEDEYVDMEFGTGALKITPAHDINDYEIGNKHNLESINIFNDDGTINRNNKLFENIDRFEARKLAVDLLEKEGKLEKVEDYTNKVGFSERTDAVIEPKLSMQWFMKMDKLAEPATHHVMNDDIHFFPSKFKNMYSHWMENVHDWCISRQLWWGQRIPAWYMPDGSYVVAESEEKALQLAKEKSGNDNLQIKDIRQDEDVLDTWFSSWLWPMSVFDGIRHPDNPDINYYYPTNDLITAPDIIFFWVARMIMSGYEFRNKMPFRNVYFTGIVRDSQRRKMSKSLGNSPEPLDLIKKYGADGVRIGMLLSSPAGNDLLFEETLCEQGRNFNNKVWNAFRLVKSWQTDNSLAQPEYCKKAVEWFDAKLSQAIEISNDHYARFRMSDVLMTFYKLFWNDFSAWYLEAVKPAFGEKTDTKTYEATIRFFEKLLKLLHPFTPFITEELYHHLANRNSDDFIMISDYPQAQTYDHEVLDEFSYLIDFITAIRDFKVSGQIPPRQKIKVISLGQTQKFTSLDSLAIKMAFLESITYQETKPEGTSSFLVGATEYFIPMDASLDMEKEIQAIGEDLKYQQGFLNTVMKKLSNEKFVQNAPPKVVELEKKKKEDAEAKIRILENKLNSLNSR